MATRYEKFGVKDHSHNNMHLQKEGQTERINGILSMYLRHYVASDHKDWVKSLSIVEFNYNTTWNESLSNTSFQVAHDFDVLRLIDLIGVR